MTERKDLALKLYNQWQGIVGGRIPAARCFIGFDGFTDEIVSAVKRRDSREKYEVFNRIVDFGERIVAAGGKSCNIELLVQRRKIGGNAAILTEALLNAGHEISFAGTIGVPGKVEPVFEELAKRCRRVFPLGSSGQSEAIEFEDGKVILGKVLSVEDVSYEGLIEQVGREELIGLLDVADLFISANWTMILKMNDLWKKLLVEIVPFLSSKVRYMFVDLADPAKRSDEDLGEALRLLRQLNGPFRVILGLNESEALRILGRKLEGRELAEAVFSMAGLHMVVVHTNQTAAAVSGEGSFFVEGPYCPHPKLSTGGGDNFNAGFCTGLLYGFNLVECLLTGVATSGYYVRYAESPSIPELADFLRQWDESG